MKQISTIHKLNGSTRELEFCFRRAKIQWAESIHISLLLMVMEMHML
jgi:hypothetical protein